MKRQVPLSLKLGLSFAVVILLSVGLVYLLTARSITQRFDEYGRTTRELIGMQLAANLSLYYREHQGWKNVHEYLYEPVVIQFGDQLFAGSMVSVSGRFSLANEDGRIFITTESSEIIGKDLAEEHLDVTLPIVVEGQQVGSLGLVPTPNPRESEFLASAMQSALLGGGISVAIALLLSVFLILQILSPLKKLTRATMRIAHGDLPDSVQLRSRDEFGQLGDSFNQMVENLKRSETLRQMMTADIAHELRTPVTIIQGTLEALIDGVYEPSNETIAPIYEETLHLGRLIDDLRDLVLAEAGELRLEKEEVDLEGLTRQVVDAAVSSLDDPPNLQVEADPESPRIQADPKRLRQVLANLLGNAFRHTPSDGEIRIGVRPSKGGIELSVSDTGPGIAEADLPHLFERFYRGDPARNRGGGTGLGLAIVKQWVEAHGGSIQAENIPGSGARFTVHLPLS
jgi:two-component system sensor histidine kinase BaeS